MREPREGVFGEPVFLEQSEALGAQLLAQLGLHFRLLALGFRQLGLDAVAQGGDCGVGPCKRFHRRLGRQAVALLRGNPRGGEAPQRQ